LERIYDIFASLLEVRATPPRFVERQPNCSATTMGGAHMQYIVAAIVLLILLSMDMEVLLIIGGIALVLWLIAHV